MMKKLMAMMLTPILLAGMLPMTASASEKASGATLHDAEDLKIYDIPACYEEYTGLSLKINGVTAPITKYPSTGADYNYVNFSFSGSATFEITAPQEITHYSVSPLAFGVEAQLSANKRTVTFSIDKPLYLIVEINNYPRLVIGADGPETDVPDTDGENVFLLTDYLTDANGGSGATASNPTNGLQAAIDAAHAAGTSKKPGIVYVPAGVYYVRNVLLRSNVHLYLAPSAVIRGTGSWRDYVKHWRKNSVGKDGTMFISNEPYSDNVKIYGRGTLDGNGHLMRQRGYLNNTFSTQNISNLTIDGVTFTDAGLWMVMINRANDVSITNTKFYNDRSDTENDGLDIDESQDVVVRHCISISEDDTYSTKTWEYDTDLCVSWEGEPEELRNVLFEDCVGWSKCCTFKVGSGAWQPQRDITFRNCYSYRSMAALKIEVLYAQRGRYTPIENVTFENIDIEGYEPHDTDNHNTRWLEFEIGNQCDTTPVNNTVVRNITVRDLGDRWSNTASMLKGMNAISSFNGVVFENISIPDGNGGFKYAETLEDMNIRTSSTAYYTPAYVNNVVIVPIPIEWEDSTTILQDSFAETNVQNALPTLPVDSGNIKWENGKYGSIDSSVLYASDAEDYSGYVTYKAFNGTAAANKLQVITGSYYNTTANQTSDKHWPIKVYASTDELGDSMTWTEITDILDRESYNYNGTGDYEMLEQIRYWNFDRYTYALPEGVKYVRINMPNPNKQGDNRTWSFKLHDVLLYDDAQILPSVSLVDGQNALDLKVGQTKSLYVKLKNMEEPTEITYTSSKPAVASVDSKGVVTALSQGQTTVTVKVTLQDGSVLTAESEVEVTNPITKLTLSETELELGKGDTFELTVTKTPADAEETYTLSSSNENVAVVDETGKITAIGYGTAVISAIGDKSGISAKCTVVVSHLRQVLIDDPLSTESVTTTPVHLEKTANVIWDAFSGTDGGVKRTDNAEEAYLIWQVDENAKRVQYLLNYNTLRCGDTKLELLVYTSADKENWTAHTMEVVGEATNVSANNDNQWNSKTFFSSTDLPEGTRYVKVAFPVITGTDIREWALFLEHFTVYGETYENLEGATDPAPDPDPAPTPDNDSKAPSTPSTDASEPEDGMPIGALVAIVAAVVAAAAAVTTALLVRKRKK